MSKTMTDDELHHHLQLARDYLDEYLTDMEKGTPEQKKKAQLLGYWVGDYITFLRKEAVFDPKKLIRYKRGSIVKAHLGYRVGSEEGGLHYSVVIDNDNALSANTVTVIPLTSIKPTTDLSSLHRTKLNMGSEIYNLLESKLNTSIKEVRAKQASMANDLSEVIGRAPDTSSPEYASWVPEYQAAILSVASRIEKMNDEITALEKVNAELQRMKAGSIALIGQITTISKIRIFDPLYPSDVFTNVRLSPESLDRIDAKIRELFMKQE